MAGNSLVTITFIILCHDSAERVLSLVRQLLREDPECHVIIHLDKKSPQTAFRQLAEVLDDDPRCHLMRNRVRCGWGTWGLVEAPLRALQYALSRKDASDYFYLLSEYCRPIRPLSELRFFLTNHRGNDFIECESVGWIKGGIREDRYLYRHYLDKRKYPKLHRWMYRFQKKLGLKKKPPRTFEVRFGSQWWCLSRDTAKKALYVNSYINEFRVLKRSWIPDECYFQSAVFFVTGGQVDSKSLTFVELDEKGRPLELTSLNLRSKPPEAFFARKYMHY